MSLLTNHKCPFCLYSFARSSAIEEFVNDDITIFRCPNPKVGDNNRKFCGKILPLNFFDAESTIISIVGSRYVGKTYYLIALLMQLKNNKSFQRLGFSGKLIGDKAAIDDILRKIDLIEKGNVIDATISREGVHEMALIVDLSISTGKSLKHVYLSFFDTPGEAYTDIEFMYKNFQCLYKADGLLFLAEPMQIKYLRPEIFSANPYLKGQNSHDLHEVFYNVIELLKFVQRNKKVRKPLENPVAQQASSGTDTTEQDSPRQAPPESLQEDRYIIEKISNPDKRNLTFWQKFFGNSTVPETLHEKIKCPIAIGITKVDQIKHLMFNDIPFDHIDFESMYLNEEKINIELIKDISQELKDIVFHYEYGEISVQNLLNAELKHYEFFGIKSGTIDSDGKIVSMIDPEDPQGVLLPLIWLLIKLKLY